MVSSTIPANNPFENDVGIFKELNIGDVIVSKMSNILVLLSIEMITLKSITNPPIIIIVFIDVIILFWRIEPKLPNDGATFLVVLDLEILLEEVLLLNFQNLNIIPTVRLAKRWVINKRKPIVVLPKRDIPNCSEL